MLVGEIPLLLGLSKPTNPMFGSIELYPQTIAREYPMIEKLIAGREIVLPGFDQAPPPADPAMPYDFVRAHGRVYNIQESTPTGAHNAPHSQIAVGVHAAKGHRTFRWLPWVLGKVSCVNLAGMDTLTGTMSGCWLVTFRYNGTLYAGHIGTYNTPIDPETIQAKAAWRNAVRANAPNNIVPVKAWNPAGWATQNVNLQGQGLMAEVYGAFTATGEVYTVVLGQSVTTGGATRRVVRVQEMRRRAGEASQDVWGF